MFEKATRMKLRFDTNKGSISVEDVWDLPLTTTSNSGLSLDNLAVAVHRELKDEGDVSFVKTRTNVSKRRKALELKMDILKHVIDVKVTESENAENAKLQKQRRDKIKELIATKEDNSLAEKSIDELKAMLKGDS